MAHILVVDDQADICEVLKAGLETAPEFFVSCCNDGTKAITILIEDQPDFAVVDMLIPGVAGLDVAATAAERNVPILFITGNLESAQDLVAARVPCIVKPFRLEYLIEQVRRQLDDREENLRCIRDFVAERRRGAGPRNEA